MVLGIIAGGPGAMFQAVEGAEDDPLLGKAAVTEANVNDQDTVVGISASGQAPYVLGALQEAKARGAATVGLTTNKPSALETVADVTIAPVVGPEVLAGSTRLKSGTAQKMVLNMLSTGAMIEIGKTYGNLMVDVQATNHKLEARAVRIVRQVSETSVAEAKIALEHAGGSAKTAIVMLHCGIEAEAARRRLSECDGFLRQALAEVNEKSA
jgi:N-acetylmuramic acid 6-phosphate etherase